LRLAVAPLILTFGMSGLLPPYDMHRYKFLYYIYKYGRQLIFYITDVIRLLIYLSIGYSDLFKNTWTFQSEQFITSNFKTLLYGGVVYEYLRVTACYSTQRRKNLRLPEHKVTYLLQCIRNNSYVSELAFIHGRKPLIFVLKSSLLILIIALLKDLVFLEDDVPLCCLYVCIFIVLI